MFLKNSSIQKAFALFLILFYTTVGTVGELFHSHNNISISQKNAGFTQHSGCGVTHHHTSTQKGECLACVRAGNPASLSISLIVRCYNETEFVSIEHSSKLHSISSPAHNTRGPPNVIL